MSRADLARLSFEPYRTGELDGLVWQDARHVGGRQFAAHMDAAREGGGPAETMRYDGNIVGGMGFVRMSARWWIGAIGMVEGAPRIAWRYVIRRARDWNAHVVRSHDVRCIETRVVATFAAGHHLVAALGFRFVGWEQGLDGTDRLVLRYQSAGERELPDINPAVADAMREAHRAFLTAYAPRALRAFGMEARRG